MTSLGCFWPGSTSGRRVGRVLVGTVQFVGRVLRGLVAATMLLALVAGLPWALWHFIGWPLPDHVPTWGELEAVLMGPMTPRFLLDVLACLLWPLWARFTFDVLVTVPDAIRAAPWSHSMGIPRPGPLHAIAGVLVSAILFAIFGSRVPSGAARSAVSEPIAAVSAVNHAIAKPADRSGILTVTVQGQAGVQSAGSHTEIVRPPERGIHDSLWRIAQRRLGNGNRWPEIWALNKGTKQIDGRVFTNPNLILPFWELRIPVVAIENPPKPSPQEQPRHDPGDEQAPPSEVPTQPESSAAEPAPRPAEGGTAISTSTGAFVGLGLAASITIAMITVRLRRRRRYRPDLQAPNNPTVAPIVRALRIAHDSVTLVQDDDSAPGGHAVGVVERLPELDARDRAQDIARAVLRDPEKTDLGVHNGCSVALDLARSKGLGLVGPGAIAAARALVVTLLARVVADEGCDARVIIPAADAQTLFGARFLARTPARLRVVEDIGTALGLAEAELLSRTRQVADTEGSSIQNFAAAASLVLVASPTPGVEGRIQAILDNGSAVGVAGVLLGQWRPGGTARVRDDGTVGATSPNLAGHLAGTRLFTLPDTDTNDLLALLHEADSGQEHPAQAPGAELATYDFVVAEAAQSDRDIAPTLLPPIGSVVIDTPTRSSAIGEASGRPAPADDHEITVEQRDAEPLDHPTSEESPAPHASTTTEAAPEPKHPVLHLEVLGRLHLKRTEPDHNDDIIDAFAPRQREILTYLALHPNGVRKETLSADLWPDAPPDRPFNTFHATLSQLRNALRKATGDAVINIVINDGGHYRLDPSLVSVDFWQLQHALTTHRKATSRSARIDALRQAAELYRSDLAEGLAADWIDAPREALRRDILDALSALIRSVRTDPEQMLELLEQARRMDPYNEAIYRDLMRVQARLGQYDSIPRTLRLLTTALAQLDQRPTRDTLNLADVLRGPHDTHPYNRDAS